MGLCDEGEDTVQVTVTNDALRWFKTELGLPSGGTVRLFAKYGGSSPMHPGFSIGITPQTPSEPVVTEHIEDLIFFVEESDIWFFDGYNLAIDYDSLSDDITYNFQGF